MGRTLLGSAKEIRGELTPAAQLLWISPSVCKMRVTAPDCGFAVRMHGNNAHPAWYLTHSQGSTTVINITLVIPSAVFLEGWSESSAFEFPALKIQIPRSTSTQHSRTSRDGAQGAAFLISTAEGPGAGCLGTAHARWRAEGRRCARAGEQETQGWKALGQLPLSGGTWPTYIC